MNVCVRGYYMDMRVYIFAYAFCIVCMCARVNFVFTKWTTENIGSVATERIIHKNAFVKFASRSIDKESTCKYK